MIAAAVLLAAVSSSAATLPSTSALLAPVVVHPVPDLSRSLHVADYARFAAIGAYRALDWKTTTTGLRIGCKEYILPKSVANNSGRLAAFEGAATAGEIAGSIYLVRHGHRKLAETIDYLSIGAGLLVDSLNERAIHSQQANQSKLVEE